jgi:hypothetical protein
MAWKKFVLPDPLAPTAKKNEQTDIIDVTKKIQAGRRKDAK